MHDYASLEPGKDLLLLSLKMRCLSEASPTPVKTFFRFVTLFYESNCMIEGNDEAAGHVFVNPNCIDKLIKTFTTDPHSVEKCLWDTFETPGDINTDNHILE